MDWLTFFAKLIESLVWPVVLVTTVVLLRKPLAELIPLLRELTYKDLHLKFGRKLEELEARANQAAIPQLQQLELAQSPEPRRVPSIREAVAPLAEASPRAAVSEAWRHVEHALDDYFDHLGKPRPRSYHGMRRVLHEEGHRVEGALTLYHDMRGLRNQAVHAREFELDPSQALEFAALADRIVASLKAAADGPQP